MFERPIDTYNSMIQCELNLDMLSEIVVDITGLAFGINVNNIVQTSGYEITIILNDIWLTYYVCNIVT